MRAAVPLASARIWTAIGLTFIVALLAAPLASLAASPDAHVDHHISATGAPDHLASVDHEHVALAMIPGAPDALADALVPRTRISLLAMGLIFPVALMGGMSLRQRNTGGRDPPRTRILVSSGRYVLARHCISRR